MKFEWNKKYAQITFWVCLAILFTVICVFFFWNYNDFGAYFDRILSMRIFNDYTKIVYSDGLKAEDINEYITIIEKMIYNYLQEHHCNEMQQINLKDEIDKLENMS